jgi:hypothetical protein
VAEGLTPARTLSVGNASLPAESGQEDQRLIA